MAVYYGDSIGQAANSEERARERWLNLQLANREFLARERARRDAIAQQNAANAMSADRLGLSLEESDRANRMNQALALSDRDYQRRYDDRAFQQAEKQLQLQKELGTLRNDNYLQRLQETEDQRTYADLAKRIAMDEIQDIPSLQDAESGRLGSEEWVDLKTRLGQHQYRRAQEAALGPELTAQQANMALRADPNFATNPAIAMNIVANNLGSSARQVLPNFERKEFQPRLDYKYAGPRDAIDWYRPGGSRTEEPPPPPPTQPAPPPPPPGLLARLGMGLRTGMGYVMGSTPTETVTRLGHSTAPLDRASTEVAATRAMEATRAAGIDALERQKLAEIKALVRGGMDPTEASFLVASKYRRPAPTSIRTY